jgi:hypothetical protein
MLFQSSDDMRDHGLYLLDKYGSCLTVVEQQDFCNNLTTVEITILLSLCQHITVQPDLSPEQLHFLQIIRNLESNLQNLYFERVEAN